MTDQMNEPSQAQADGTQNNLPSVAEFSATDAATRELRKGDLVRVAERRGPGVKTRDGGLGRIHRSFSAENGETLFDIDFVLGGRLTKIPRQDLIYTTADAEGMTERRKRDRNPSTVVKEAEESKGVKRPRAKPKRGGSAKKKGGAKGKAAAKRGKPPAGGKQKGKNTKGKGKKTTTTKAKAEPKEKEKDDTDVVVKNLYERHTRDFEKCVARLEKQDKYAFFLGDPPPEYDEHYGETGGSSTVQGSSAGKQNDILAPTMPPIPPVFPETPPFNFTVIRKRMAHGRYVLDRVRQHKERTRSRTMPALIHPKGVDWDQFRDDIVQMCDAAVARDPEGVDGGRGTLSHTAVLTKNHVLKLYDANGRRQMKEMEDDEARHKFYSVLKTKTNNEAAMQGKWRRMAFPERIYERLSSNVVCAGLSSLDERTAVYELQTNLPDSFVGLSYTYTDTGQSEGWMKSVLDDTKGTDNGALERKAALDLANDDGVVRAQVQATMTSLLIGVQDRVMTDASVLKDDELKSANWEGDVEDSRGEGMTNDSVDTTNADSPDIVEQPVWGIDCYTRRNIISCIEADFDSAIALEFIEKWLLPAINACPVSLAHNLINAARILEGLSLPTSTALEEEHGDDSGDERWSHSLLGKALKDKMNKIGPPWLKSVAHQLRLAISTLGHDFFRVHPKGHGAIVLRPTLKANSLVTFYRGEVYPSWRWGEKMDAIDLTQNRLNLRPNLPDFYNMALERPQVDPRGYGLLFVDASRKAGHGSSLSHSCEPTCEVRVAAVDGQLCLAMTTIRELELGEELTFDYNAVTESLNEYRSAVCLCGHGRCRGSFLHFATADCYQEVLNRNSPIAVRFSNLIKGCAKQVMSEADVDLLATHGFGTAAFGAASFRDALLDSGCNDGQYDSMENVPIWLRTYVADTIRYIEYERRALPVMLLCNHLKMAEAKDGDKPSQKSRKNGRGGRNTKDAKPAKKQKKTSGDETKPIKGSKPEPVFLFFSRKRSDFFRSQLLSHGLGHLKGREQQGAMLKIASSCWKALSDDLKQQWKEKSILDWKQNGGEEKARLEAERQKAQKANPKKRKPNDAAAHGSSKKRRKPKSESVKSSDALVYSSNLSFEAADAEGVSAMEQRIQQLTQTLSRVGRVLNRHRQTSRASSLQGTSPKNGHESIHSPLATLSDDDVVYWLWRHERGPVRSLLRSCSSEKCVSPSLVGALKTTEKKYSTQLEVDASSLSGSRGGLFPPNARAIVTEALLELRDNLCSGLLSLEGERRQYELERSRFKAKARRDAAKRRKEAETVLPPGVSQSSTTVRDTVSSVLDAMVNTVVERSETPRPSPLLANSATKAAVEDDLPMSPWLQHFSDRWKIEAAADLLLFYAHTSTFFAIKPYASLESTPIEVYARELGNEVPQSIIEIAHNKTSDESADVVLIATKTKNDGGRPEEASPEETSVSKSLDGEEARGDAGSGPKLKQSSKAKSGALCKPDDIITNVTVTYQGDYVLSQLLQWYNGGIGQKPGLPDLEGCVLLPSMSGPWQGTIGGVKSGKIKPTRYASEVRSLLLDWLNDPRKRGSPFDGLLSQVFPRREQEAPWDDDKFKCSPVGSPVLDLLVTGEDTSLRNIATALFQTVQSTDKASGLSTHEKTGSATDRLQNTVDEGMPAQAVSHWVQCENPDCLKWRKLPWHVDVDALPEKFFCSDNKWDAAASSCDAPEDTWDENDTSLANNGIAKESDAGMVSQEDEEDVSSSTLGGINVKQFVIGARFDVVRSGKDFYSTGEVVDVDLSGTTKRVMFHFPKTKAIYDEWIEIGSSRIAPLNSKQDLNKGPGSKKKSTGKKIAQEANEKNGKAVPKPVMLEKRLVSTTTGNGPSGDSRATIASLEAQVLQGLIGSVSMARGMEEATVSDHRNASFLQAGSQPAYSSYSSRLASHGSQLIASGMQSSPPRDTLTASQTSPERTSSMYQPPREKRAAHAVSSPAASHSYTVPRKSVNRSDAIPIAPTPTFTIPRKSSTSMNGPPANGRATNGASTSSNSFTIPRKSEEAGSSESLISRIPHPVLSDASSFRGMGNASALTHTALNGNYFPSNLQHQLYQQQQAQLLQQANQYFGSRTYWQGQELQPQQQQQRSRQPQQQQDPRGYGGSPTRRQYEGGKR